MRTSRKFIIIFLACALVIAAGLGAFFWFSQKEMRQLRHLEQALQLPSGGDRKEYERGCAPGSGWDDFGCLLRLSRTYIGLGLETSVLKRLENQGWQRHPDAAARYIDPFTNESLQVIFTKRVAGGTFCAGTEHRFSHNGTVDHLVVHLLGYSNEACQKIRYELK